MGRSWLPWECVAPVGFWRHGVQQNGQRSPPWAVTFTIPWPLQTKWFQGQERIKPFLIQQVSSRKKFLEYNILDLYQEIKLYKLLYIYIYTPDFLKVEFV